MSGSVRPSRGPAARGGAAADDSAPSEMCRADRIAWGCLVAMVFLVPLTMTNLTFLGFDLPLTYDQVGLTKVVVQRVLVILAAGAWVWRLLRQGGPVRRTPVDWLVVAFLVWVAFTTLTSVHPPTALFGKWGRYEGLLTFVTYAATYFLVQQYADRPSRVRQLALALFWSSVGVAGYGVLQYLGWDPVTWGERIFEANRAFSTYGNPNLLGGFLVFSVPVGLALALADSRRPWRLVYWSGFTLNSACLLVTFTRGAWVGAALAAALVGAVAWRHRTRLYGVDFVPAAAIAAVAAGIILRSASSTSEVLNFGKRLSTIFEFGAGSGQTRSEIWQAAWAAIKARPATGWGADTFELVFPRFKPAAYVRDAGYKSVADNAHNYPLQLAAGIGVLGAVMMYGIVAWVAVRSWRVVFGRPQGEGTLILGAFWAASAGYLLHLMAGVSIPSTTFLLWMAGGVLLSPTARVVHVGPLARGRVLAVVAVCIAAAGIVLQAFPVAADRALIKAQVLSGSDRSNAIEMAVRLNPYCGEYRAALGEAHVADLRAVWNDAEHARETGTDASPYLAAAREAAAQAETAFRDAVAFAPDDVDNYVLLADLFNTAAEMFDTTLAADAVEVARAALPIAPRDPLLRVQLARGLLQMGERSQAVRELAYCLELDPSNGEAAYLLALAYEEAGRREDAISVLKEVEALRPGQPGLRDAIERLEAEVAPESH